MWLLRKRPVWVVVLRVDAGGRTHHAERGPVELAAAGTVLRMRPRPRGWRTAAARLPDGTALDAKRRRSVRGGCEFFFDRPLPPDTQIVLAGRSIARAGAGAEPQWWEES